MMQVPGVKKTKPVNSQARPVLHSFEFEKQVSLSAPVNSELRTLHLPPTQKFPGEHRGPSLVHGCSGAA